MAKFTTEHIFLSVELEEYSVQNTNIYIHHIIPR